VQGLDSAHYVKNDSDAVSFWAREISRKQSVSLNLPHPFGPCARRGWSIAAVVVQHSALVVLPQTLPDASSPDPVSTLSLGPQDPLEQSPDSVLVLSPNIPWTFLDISSTPTADHPTEIIACTLDYQLKTSQSDHATIIFHSGSCLEEYTKIHNTTHAQRPTPIRVILKPVLLVIMTTRFAAVARGPNPQLRHARPKWKLSPAHSISTPSRNSRVRLDDGRNL
jgi:hypothetical protein